jgi:hypothetical protein
VTSSPRDTHVFTTVTDAVTRHMADLGICSVMGEEDRPERCDSDPVCALLVVAIVVVLVIVRLRPRRWK